MVKVILAAATDVEDITNIGWTDYSFKTRKRVLVRDLGQLPLI